MLHSSAEAAVKTGGKKIDGDGVLLADSLVLTGDDVIESEKA